MRIAFRVDASTTMGSGHIMRCLTLADALRARRWETVFVSRPHPGNLLQLISARGHQVLALDPPQPDWAGEAGGTAHSAWLGTDWATDAVQTKNLLADSGPWDWLVVDHYALDARWETACRSLARQLMVIDDLADRPHASDLLLDQNLSADDSRYRPLIQDCTTLLLGPSYALLRPMFAERRPQSLETAASVRKILVFLGGSDPSNVTGRVLSCISRAGLEAAVDVVLGSSCPHLDTIRRQCAGQNWKLHVQIDNMVELVASADLAIGSSGVASWERACLGVPTLAVSIADNQNKGAEALAQVGAHLYLGPMETVSDTALEAGIRLLASAPWLRGSLAQNSYRLVDGQGPERIIRHLAPPALTLRPAKADDCDRLLTWRNDPITRSFSFDTTEVSTVEHKRWFTASLTNPDRLLLIGMVDGQEIGVIRYDLVADKARVSVHLAPDQRGAGLGTLLIQAGNSWLHKWQPQVRIVTAEVFPNNKASLGAFLAAGFRQHHHVLHADLSQ